MASSLQSKRTRAQQARKRRRRTIGVVLCALFLCGGVITLARLEAFTIRSVHIQNETVTVERELRTVIDRVLAGNQLFVFPRRNSFLLPRDELAAAVLSAFPRVSDVRFDIPNPHTLILTLSEREPFALWCGETSGQSIGTNCYFLDREGIVYVRAPSFSGDAYFLYHGPLEGAADPASPIGGRLFSTGQFLNISNFVALLQEAGVPAVSFSVTAEGDYEVRLKSGARVLMTSDADLAVVLQNVVSALSAPALQGENGRHIDIDLIDVRFGNRIYYTLE